MRFGKVNAAVRSTGSDYGTTGSFARRQENTCAWCGYFVQYVPALWRTTYGQIAQLVEQRTENPRAEGSSPPLTTIKIAGQNINLF